MIGQGGAGHGRRERELARQPDYRQVRRVHPGRAAEAGAGAGLLSYGIPAMVAQHRGRYPAALAEAHAVLGKVKWPQAALAAVNAVPTRYRPRVATLAGAALLNAAVPVTTTRNVRSTRR